MPRAARCGTLRGRGRRRRLADSTAPSPCARGELRTPRRLPCRTPKNAKGKEPQLLATLAVNRTNRLVSRPPLCLRIPRLHQSLRAKERLMKEHAVVIVGAGPTGLMLAGELSLAGVDVVIIERRSDQNLV